MTRQRKVLLLSSILALTLLGSAMPFLTGMAREYWWMRKLRQGDESERTTAMEELGKMGSRRAIPLLIEELDKAPDDLSVGYSLRALTQIGSVCVPALIEALRSDIEHKRASAAWVLHGFSSDAGDAIPELIRMSREDTDELRGLAFLALRAISPTDDRVIERLGEAIGSDESSAVRIVAIRLAGSLGPSARRAAPALARAVQDSDPEVREAANEALNRLQVENRD